MNNLDFTGIDPLRVAEARRRVKALNIYLALPSPTTADAKRISGSIGLSRWQFQRLARAWREHRDPKLLVVGRRGASCRDYGVASRAGEIAQEEITAAGMCAELATIAPEVERRCYAEGVRPPSRPTIWNYIRRAREAGTQVGGPPRIVIGRMWFHLPVATLTNRRVGTDMPMLLIAVALPERIIIAHRLSFDDRQPPSVTDLMSDVLAQRSPNADGRLVLIESDDRRAASDVLAVNGQSSLRSHKGSVQRELSRAFGARLGNLAVVYRRALARPQTKRVIQRQDQRISAKDAVDVITRAVDSHSAAMVTGPLSFDLA